VWVNSIKYGNASFTLLRQLDKSVFCVVLAAVVVCLCFFSSEISSTPLVSSLLYSFASLPPLLFPEPSSPTVSVMKVIVKCFYII
jgi:hypothetical protein